MLMLLLLLAAGAGPSTAVYPPQELPLAFSHARHDLPCARCHARVAASTSVADRLLPAEADCAGAGCHVVDRTEQKGCAFCHRGTPAALVVRAANLKFSHALHPGACSSCHGDARKIGLMTRADLPRMAACLGCHDGKAAPARCVTCHPAEASGRLRTDFPSGKLAPEATHPPDVRENHARAARADAASCESCHTRRFCVDCHDGRLKPLDFHAGDYQLTHPVDARRNTPECSACHRAQSFCTGCHARAGVSTDRRTSEFGASTPFHPQSWHEGDDHAREARRNLRACASCHREDFCASCHAQKVSPHPTSWRGSRRCATLRAKNPRVCLRCHLEGATCDP